MQYDPGFGILEPTYDGHGASDGPVMFTENFTPYKDLDASWRPRWPGPDSTLPREFKPNLGAKANLKNHGDKPDMSGFRAAWLPALYIPRPGQRIAVNSASQQFYSSSTNQAIPGIFVPSDAVNMPNGPATQ